MTTTNSSRSATQKFNLVAIMATIVAIFASMLATTPAHAQTDGFITRAQMVSNCNRGLAQFARVVQGDVDYKNLLAGLCLNNDEDVFIEAMKSADHPNSKVHAMYFRYPTKIWGYVNLSDLKQRNKILDRDEVIPVCEVSIVGEDTIKRRGYFILNNGGWITHFKGILTSKPTELEPAQEPPTRPVFSRLTFDCPQVIEVGDTPECAAKGGSGKYHWLITTYFDDDNVARMKPIEGEDRVVLEFDRTGTVQVKLQDQVTDNTVTRTVHIQPPPPAPAPTLLEAPETVGELLDDIEERVAKGATSRPPNPAPVKTIETDKDLETEVVERDERWTVPVYEPPPLGDASRLALATTPSPLVCVCAPESVAPNVETACGVEGATEPYDLSWWIEGVDGRLELAHRGRELEGKFSNPDPGLHEFEARDEVDGRSATCRFRVMDRRPKPKTRPWKNEQGFRGM